jgi:flagellar transcriptional activator FlhC
MRKKTVVSEMKDIQLAMDLIKLGARLQVLESETMLSRERLLRLYKEIRGMSPPKGMLPFSTDWFLTWQPNVHASVFANIFQYLVTHGDCRGIEATIKSYKLYLEHCLTSQMEPALSVTRAWTLVRFLEGKMLQTVPCEECGGHFVVHAQDLHKNYRCGICRPPSRAGKTKKTEQIEVLELKAA